MTHGDIPKIHKALRDVEHDLCAALVLSGDGYAFLVAEAATGEILAWDGWYFEPTDKVPSDVQPLADVDWHDWDDMPTKLLIRKQSQWANEQMAFWLIPTFSPAREAGGLVAMHRDSETSSEARKNMRDSRVVAYLPIVDRDVYEAALQR